MYSHPIIAISIYQKVSKVLCKRIQNMSSARSKRARNEAGSSVTSNGNEVPEREKSSRKRRAIKVEMEIDDDSGHSGHSDKDNGEATSKPGKNSATEPPKDWETIIENVRNMLSQLKNEEGDVPKEDKSTQDPKATRFRTLISLMLSSQTKDQLTAAAVDRLKEKGLLTVQAMLGATEAELEEIIKPVSFYKRKAIYLKKTAGILHEKFDDDIPREVDDLLALPGVGPKMANLCMNESWNENVGMAVDRHVIRVANRLKWTKSDDAEKSRKDLESWVPKDLWQEVDTLLCDFGQKICVAINPKCETCLNNNICPASTVRKPKKKKE